MDGQIPKGYEKSYSQFFTWKTGNKFLKEYCGSCKKEGKCEIEEGNRLAMGNNYSFWHNSLVAVSNKPGCFFLEDKVICLEHESKE